MAQLYDMVQLLFDPECSSVYYEQAHFSYIFEPTISKWAYSQIRRVHYTLLLALRLTTT